MKRQGEYDAQRIFRRPKGRPRDDLCHTLAVGLPIAALLFVALPLIFHMITR